jgi:hypothetical protein
LLCVTAREMRVGLSMAICRDSHQTASGGCSQKLWSCALEEKSHKMRQVWSEKTSESEPWVTRRNIQRWHQNRGCPPVPGKAQEVSAYCLSGVRRRRGVSSVLALVWNVGTLHGMQRENPISVDHEGGKYRCT